MGRRRPPWSEARGVPVCTGALVHYGQTVWGRVSERLDEVHGGASGGHYGAQLGVGQRSEHWYTMSKQSEG